MQAEKLLENSNKKMILNIIKVILITLAYCVTVIRCGWFQTCPKINSVKSGDFNQVCFISVY